MASQFVNLVSPDIGELLELLNASEEQDDCETENIAIDDWAAQEDGHRPQELLQAAEAGAVLRERQRMNEALLAGDLLAKDVLPRNLLVHDILAQVTERDLRNEPLAPEASGELPRRGNETVENRFAAHIVRGMQMTKRGSQA